MGPLTGQPEQRSRYDQLNRRNVVDISDERVVRLGHVNEISADGASEELEVILPDGKAIQLDFLLPLSNLYSKLAHAYLEWTKQPSVRSFATKYSVALNLKAFSEFLSCSGMSQIQFGELTVSHIKGFVAWLNSQANEGRSWSEDTRRDKLGAVRIIFDQVRELYPDELQTSFHVPNGMWVGIAQKANPVAVMDQSEWKGVLQACMMEATKSIQRFEHCQALMIAGRGKVPDNPTKRTPYNDPAVFAASLDAAYPGVIPHITEIRPDNLRLAESLQHVHGGQFLRGFQPYGRELVPFVLLLGIYTLFNATPLLNLERSNIEFRHVLGQRRLIITAYKARAGRSVSRSFPEDPEDQLSPSELVRFLERWTSRIRTTVEPDMQDRLFLLVPTGKSEARGFHHKLGPTHDIVWKYSMRQFFKDHELKGFGLRNIRKTGLDAIHFLFSGDVRAVAAAGGHTSLDVSDKHYKSSAAARRNDEALSGVMTTRERYFENGGSPDPRGLPSNTDIHAATPGAICLDPYDSPVPGQRPGQICSAYGMCWICPLLQTAPGSSYQLARAHQFREEVLKARGYLVPHRWHRRWRPVLTRLDEQILPAFTDPAVLERASLLINRLPRLPKLD